MRKWIILVIVLLFVVCGIFWGTADKDMRRLILNLPTNTDVLFWSISQRDAAFRAMDRMPIHAKSRTISTSKDIYHLPKGEPLDAGIDVDAYMKDQRTAALVIVQDGKIRLEKYGLDFGPGGRWTSFSVVKSITSTLVGAAIKDGYIKSIDDKVSDYIPDLRGSVYDNENYRNWPNPAFIGPSIVRLTHLEGIGRIYLKRDNWFSLHQSQH